MTFVYNEIDYNTKAAKAIVPVLIELLDPKSVVDVGCGIGTWLSVFQDLGINDILGIDGEYVDKDLLHLYVEKNKFISHDLTTPFSFDRKFDLVISLEVAEHLPEKAAGNFVKTLVSLGDNIIFSAAIPHQDGERHINEQWQTYWSVKFQEHGFELYDCIRPVFWSNENVNWWYKQNIFLITKVARSPLCIFNKVNTPLDIVHPELYYKKINRIEYLNKNLHDLYSGEIPVRTALSILLKSIKKKLRQS